MELDRTMKQAILITAYKDPRQLLDLIGQFETENFNIYIHWDKKQKFDKALLIEIKNTLNVRYIETKYKINWGGVNQLKACLHLSELALQNKQNELFHTLSGQDFPVQSAKRFMEIAENARIDRKNYLECIKLPNNSFGSDGGMHRVRYFNFYDLFNYRKSEKWVKLLIRIQRKVKFQRSLKNFGGQLYGGSNWWSLTRGCLQYIIDYNRRNPNYLKRFKFTFAAEELYFQTIIMNSDLKSTIVNNNLRYIDWSSGRGGYPAYLSEIDYNNIIESGAIFARKIDFGTGQSLINKLKEYRNTNN